MRMIASSIATELRTITAVTDIFGQRIYSGSKFLMEDEAFLVISQLPGDTYKLKSEDGPIENTYNLQFLIVGTTDDFEDTILGRVEDITDAMGYGCNRLQEFDSLRVNNFERTNVGPIVYNQERPTIAIDFTFLTGR